MDEDVKELRVELGKNVEATGRMLQRERSLDLKDLTLLGQTLAHSAEALDTLQRTLALWHVSKAEGR